MKEENKAFAPITFKNSASAQRLKEFLRLSVPTSVSSLYEM